MTKSCFKAYGIMRLSDQIYGLVSLSCDDASCCVNTSSYGNKINGPRVTQVLLILLNEIYEFTSGWSLKLVGRQYTIFQVPFHHPTIERRSSTTKAFQLNTPLTICFRITKSIGILPHSIQQSTKRTTRREKHTWFDEQHKAHMLSRPEFKLHLI